jgi:hypothetical protein
MHCVLLYCFLVCCVAYLYPSILQNLCRRVWMSYYDVIHAILAVTHFYTYVLSALQINYLKISVDKCIIREIIFVLMMITNPNYNQYKGKFYKPKSGVAKGSPLFSNMTEIFLQDLQQNRTKHSLECEKNRILQQI